MTWLHSTLPRMETNIAVHYVAKRAETSLMPKGTLKVNTFLLMEDMSVKYVTATLKHGMHCLVTIPNITETSRKINMYLS